MKRFLIGVGVLMVMVLIIVIVLFVYLQTVLAPERVPVESVSSTSIQMSSEVVEQSTTTSTAVISTVASGTATTASDSAGQTITQEAATSGDVPLRTLPLTAEQRSLLGTFGIDYDTFVITEEMQTCARDRLGEARFAEIIAGSAPSSLEGVSLIRCL